MTMEGNENTAPMATTSCRTPECKNDALTRECFCGMCKARMIKALNADLAVFFTRLENKLLAKLGDYGTSYKTMPVPHLKARLKQEWRELEDRKFEDPDELIDVAAICMMVHSRVKKD